MRQFNKVKLTSRLKTQVLISRITSLTAVVKFSNITRPFTQESPRPNFSLIRPCFRDTQEVGKGGVVFRMAGRRLGTSPVASSAGTAEHESSREVHSTTHKHTAHGYELQIKINWTKNSHRTHRHTSTIIHLVPHMRQ